MTLIGKESPFQPGIPVDPLKFKGRNEIIGEISRYFPGVVNGNAQHFFIRAKRGMGKTSLANYISTIVRNEYKMLCAHVMNNGVHNIETLIVQIIERLLNEINSEMWSDKIFDFFKDSIEEVGFMNVSLKFKPSKNFINNIKDNFALFLVDFFSQIKDKKGIFIIIDDINGLSKTPEFANWYKSFTDTLATTYLNKSPIAMMLTGYSEKLTILHNYNPSFTRIFNHNELTSLTDDEIRSFYTDIFNSENISFDDDAISTMVLYCSGMPTIMQEIGDAVFYLCKDNHIDKECVLDGVIVAGNRIGIKYLQPVLDKKIRSEYYVSIFEKIGEYLASDKETFTKRDLEPYFNDDEIKVFKDFLSRAKELGIIELASSKKQSEYQFTNKLYSIYFLIQRLKSKNNNLNKDYMEFL